MTLKHYKIFNRAKILARFARIYSRSSVSSMSFLIFVNDIDCSITSDISKFAADIKLYRIVNDLNDASLMQQDLDKLISWSQIWQMSFNVDK